MTLRGACVIAALLLAPLAANAAELKCSGASNVEEFRYAWHLRGALGWIAGFVFPRSGYGDLKTTYPKAGEDTISSELVITPANGKSGFYMYQSQMDEDGSKTLMTYHGYAWGEKSRNERTVFDYLKRLARIHKETPGGAEDNVQMLPKEDRDMRDILTAIHFLRNKADEIKAPLTTTIYSDGHEYAVIFRPVGREAFTIDDKRVNAIGFEVVGAPTNEGHKWTGGVQVWVSDDERRIPFRIAIVETGASLQLDLQTIDGCAFLNAGK
jgi:hypothetical protein